MEFLIPSANVTMTKSREGGERTVKKIHAQIIPTFFSSAYFAYFIHKTKTDMQTHSRLCCESEAEAEGEWNTEEFISKATRPFDGAQLCKDF